GAARGAPPGAPPARAPRRARHCRGLPGRPVPQPPLRPVLDDGPVARGRPPAQSPGRRSRVRRSDRTATEGGLMPIVFTAAREIPSGLHPLGRPVFAGPEPVPGAEVEIDRRYCERRGFEGKPGETLALPGPDGATLVAVGLGAPGAVTGEKLRRAGAAFARTCGQATVTAFRLPGA